MQAIIQVAIGMVFVYSLLSILVTTLNTVIANLLRWRSTHLKTALESLITDPEVQAQFMSHPLINIVNTQMVEPSEVATTETAEIKALQVRSAEVNTVDWIDPKTFAQVMSSILAEKAGLELYGPLLLAVDAAPASPAKDRVLELVFRLQNTGVGLEAIHEAVPTLPVEVQVPVLKALKPLDDRMQFAQLTATSGGQLLPVLEGLRNVNDEAFRRALKVVVASAQSLDQAQANLEDWFNQRMDQLSTAYKRHLTYLTLAIGCILALVLNADSLQIARTLWDDPALRETVVAAVQSAATSAQFAQQFQQAQQAQQQAQQQLDPQTPEATAEPGLNTGQILSDATEQITTSLTQISALNLPIGWEYTPLERRCVADEDGKLPVGCGNMRNLWLLGPDNNPDWLGLLIRKLIGIVVTVIAIGQGAPFWVDLIRRIVNPRSS
ncbi:MAG: hypothetical protein IT319_10740 [Anaerolineae bacterium]|nr:hypothetical protein [Anaerolineae bacterium]